MNFGTRFKNGLYMATQSFSMIWYQKKLLFYFGIPAFITFFVRLLFQQESFKNFYQLMPSIVRVLAFMAPAAITTFFTVALIYHAAKIMNGQQSTIKQSLYQCFGKLSDIFAWMLPSICVQLLIAYVAVYEGPFFGLIALGIFMLLLLWGLYTFFVLPLITFKKQSLLASIKDSTKMAKESLPEIMGGEFWFILVVMLTAAPLIIYGVATARHAFDPIFNFIVIFTSEIIINACISTAHTIFKTMLYLEQAKKHPELTLNTL